MPGCSGTELSGPPVQAVLLLHNLIKHPLSQHGSTGHVHLEEEGQFPVTAQKGVYEIKLQV